MGEIKTIFLKIIKNLIFTKNLVEIKNHLKYHVTQIFSYLSFKLTSLNSRQ